MSSTISSIPSVSTTSSATATCTTAVPGKYGYIPPEACNALYSYYPSFGAAIFLAFLFGTVTGLHIFQAAKYKKVSSWTPKFDPIADIAVDLLLGDHHGLHLGTSIFHLTSHIDPKPSEHQLLYILVPSCASSSSLYGFQGSLVPMLLES